MHSDIDSYLYYDKECDGDADGTNSQLSGFFLNMHKPSIVAKEDLDGDRDCRNVAYTLYPTAEEIDRLLPPESPHMHHSVAGALPQANTTWKVWCGEKTGWVYAALKRTAAVYNNRVVYPTSYSTSDCGICKAARQGNMAEVQKWLHADGSMINETDGGITPLMFATWEGHLDVVKLLINESAPLEAVDLNGMTALIHACSAGSAKVAKFLCEHGANLEAMDNNGLTPVKVSALNGHLDVLKVLVGQGARLESVDREGLTPLLWAVRSGKDIMARDLIEQGASVETWFRVQFLRPSY